MKTKAIFFLLVSAILTLSFTYTSISSTNGKEKTTAKTNTKEPVGGFISEDKL